MKVPVMRRIEGPAKQPDPEPSPVMEQPWHPVAPVPAVIRGGSAHCP
jgi:hypothetical protein